MEAPDVTGSSLTLGAAGSRRTVYLIDENPKLPDSSSNAENELTPGGNNNNNNNNNSGTSNGSANNNAAPNDQSPSTFLMYNRISNVIGDTTLAAPSAGHSLNNTALSQDTAIATAGTPNGTKEKKRSDDDKAIWYEYGCV